ncbi:AbfB domain-containing protein [Luedemannella flava]
MRVTQRDPVGHRDSHAQPQADDRTAHHDAPHHRRANHRRPQGSAASVVDRRRPAITAVCLEHRRLRGPLKRRRGPCRGHHGQRANSRHAANFTVVAGLARSSCFSFRTGNGAYLRHRNYRIYVEVDNENDPNLFRRDATFCKAAGAPPGSFRFSSENFPEYFIHARDGGLWIDKAPPPHESSFVVSTAWE